MFASFSRLRVAAVCLAFAFTSSAQDTPSLPRPADSLRAMTRAAATIFRGTVVSVARVPANRPDQVEAVEITFHVDEAIRGTTTGATLRIREWAGLWTSAERYRAGEKLVLFLYPTSRLGLTSPVFGELGRLPVDDAGRVLLRVQPTDSNSRVPNAEPVLPSMPAAGRQSSRSLSPRDFRLAIRRAAQE